MSKSLAGLYVTLALCAASAIGQTTVTNSNNGVAGAVPVYSGAATLGAGSSSAIYQSGSNVGIGTTSPQASLTVAGTIAGRTANGYPGTGAGYYALVTNNTDADNGGLTIQYLSAGVLTNGLNLENGSLAMAGPIYGRTANGYPNSPAPGYYALTTNNADANNGGLTIQYLTAGQLVNGFSLLSNGYVGIGTTNPQAKLEINGNLRFTADGSVQTTAWTGVLCGGDYAESMDVAGSRRNYEPGDLLVLDTDHAGKVLKSIEPYSTAVSGIYATKPGVVGRRQLTAISDSEVPMAMVGVVPTKVSAENGAIHVGDLLVSSSTPGHAMKGTDRSRLVGAVIGKAMGGLESGTGTIEVLVTLQ